MTVSTSKPILCIDFDGVLHSYTSGWQGADVVSDPPVPGTLEWLVNAIGHFELCIYSSRSSQKGGIDAMKNWLYENLIEEGCPGMIADGLMRVIKFPTQKPAAFLTIDDRAICFNGAFPSYEELLAFKPWNKKEKEKEKADGT